MTKKSSAKIQHREYAKISEEIGRVFLREKTKFFLSLPIPMRYEVWSELHRYLEELE